MRLRRPPPPRNSAQDQIHTELVLLPATRWWGAVAAAIIMMVSMVTNARVDGLAYFLKVLPFDLLALALAGAVAWHHRGDFRGFRAP